MNPSLQLLLIGAVQPYLGYAVADSVVQQLSRRKQQCHAVFAWHFGWMDMPFEVLEWFLNLFLYAGGLGLLPICQLLDSSKFHPKYRWESDYDNYAL